MIVDLLEKSSNTVGIIGVILLLIAYYLLNANKMSAIDMSYQVLNFLGAIFILFSLFFHWNTASALIEMAWIVISLMGMYRTVYTHKQKPKMNNLYVISEMKG